MRGKQMHWIASWLPFWLALLVGVVEAQSAGNVRLEIRLRDSKGTAVVGETVVLQRLPEEETISPECTTNDDGECTWFVRRGLYQALFDRTLDNVSALAVAEGGLRGLGITVGDTDITYHFTFHNDGRVYFDAAPEAAVPSPIIPAGDVLQGGVAPTTTPAALEIVAVAEAVTPEPMMSPETAVPPDARGTWRLLLLIGGGLFIGGGLHFWSQKRQNQTQTETEEEPDA